MANISAARMAQLKSPMMLLVFAAVMAAAVAWIAYHYLQRREETIKQEIAAKGARRSTPQVTVAVPRIDAQAGTVLNLNNFVARPIDADLVYPDTILAADFPSLEGIKLARPVLHGRPVRLTDLTAPEVRDVAAILPSGQRALTIEIDNLNSISQTLRPNHHIDVFLVSKAPRRDEAPDDSDASDAQASIYMQDLVVLATGSEFQDISKVNDAQAAKMARPGDVPGKERGYDTVTVLVSPAEAARLIVGQRMGSFRVTLRGTKDRAPIEMAALRASDLLPNSPKARDGGIEFIVGGKSNLVSQMALPPSQELAKAARQAAATPAPTPPVPDKQNMTVTVPMAPRSNVTAFDKN